MGTTCLRAQIRLGPSVTDTRIQRMARNILQYLYSNQRSGQGQTGERAIRCARPPPPTQEANSALILLQCVKVGRCQGLLICRMSDSTQ